jgi:hypothetical protein
MKYKNNIFITQKFLCCTSKLLILHKMGTEAVQFLVGRFSLFGIEGQNWMPIAAVLVAGFIFYIWMTRNRS